MAPTDMIPEPARKPLAWVDIIGRVLLIPIFLFVIKDYITIKETLATYQIRINQVETQWGVLQSFEGDIDELKIQTMVNSRLIGTSSSTTHSCGAESNKNEFTGASEERPELDRKTPKSSPGVGRTGTGLPVEDNKLELMHPNNLKQYIQQKQLIYEGGKK